MGGQVVMRQLWRRLLFCQKPLLNTRLLFALCCRVKDPIVFLKYFIGESSLYYEAKKKQSSFTFHLALVAIFLKLTDKDRFLFVFNSFLNFSNHDICDMTLKLFIPVQWDEINFEEALTRANQAQIYCNKYVQI